MTAVGVSTFTYRLLRYLYEWWSLWHFTFISLRYSQDTYEPYYHGLSVVIIVSLGLQQYQQCNSLALMVA